MIRILALLVALLLSQAALAGDRPVVVELFTSQGCPNCPPAQTMLSEIAERDNILVLSWPVDYWDFMGWKDTFARPENARRQESYNRALRQPGVYTPQIVVDGTFEVVGSRRESVRSRIAEARAVQRQDVSLALNEDDGFCVVEMPDAGSVHEGPVHIEAIYFRAEDKVSISAGDNRGRMMQYRNVVLMTRDLGIWSDSNRTLRIPVRDAMDAGADHMAILLHLGMREGPIVGAASMPLHPPGL
ncbi:MAG: thioredoxin family protein [Rhodothalassiaceae bacterium]